MKRLIIPICILLLSTTAFAQTRSRTTSKPKTSKTSTTTSPAASAIKIEGATKIATQIKNLTTFLYLLGGVARNIESMDAAAKSGQDSPTNERNKATLRTSFQDFRVGLDALEVHFRQTQNFAAATVAGLDARNGRVSVRFDGGKEDEAIAFGEIFKKLKKQPR